MTITDSLSVADLLKVFDDTVGGCQCAFTRVDDGVLMKPWR